MLSTHILDTSTGTPASNVCIHLDHFLNDQWQRMETLITNKDGRSVFETEIQIGKYQLTFETAAHFQSRGLESFFPQAQVCFEIKDSSRKYHIPLLISPFGYTTYRGS